MSNNTSNLKIAHLVASDKGGAYRAAQRINNSLCLNGVESKIVVLIKSNPNTECSAVIYNGVKIFFLKVFRKISSLRLKQKGINGYFYENILGVNILKNKEIQEANVINIHWINDGMLSYKGIKKLCRSEKKIVWTMHDMFAFTAGCYYDNYCGNYEKYCNNCKLTELNPVKQEYINNIYQKKKSAYSLNMSFVGCSNWITECAKKSTLCSVNNIINIPNPIDTNVFKPIQKQDAYEEFRISYVIDKKTILFGAMSSTTDKRKGYQLLLEALKMIQDKKRYRLVVFGDSEYSNNIDGLECICIGNLNSDKKIIALYSLADVFIAPSIQENLSNTVLESLACGTPVVAFDIGGMSDMIAHKINGYLASPFDTKDLSNGIIEMAENKNRLQVECVKTVKQKFSMETVGSQYFDFYQKI